MKTFIIIISIIATCLLGWYAFVQYHTADKNSYSSPIFSYKLAKERDFILRDYKAVQLINIPDSLKEEVHKSNVFIQKALKIERDFFGAKNYVSYEDSMKRRLIIDQPNLYEKKLTLTFDSLKNKIKEHVIRLGSVNYSTYDVRDDLDFSITGTSLPDTLHLYLWTLSKQVKHSPHTTPLTPKEYRKVWLNDSLIGKVLFVAPQKTRQKHK